MDVESMIADAVEEAFYFARWIEPNLTDDDPEWWR